MLYLGQGYFISFAPPFFSLCARKDTYICAQAIFKPSRVKYTNPNLEAEKDDDPDAVHHKVNQRFIYAVSWMPLVIILLRAGSPMACQQLHGSWRGDGWRHAERSKMRSGNAQTLHPFTAYVRRCFLEMVHRTSRRRFHPQTKETSGMPIRAPTNGLSSSKQ